MMLREAVRRLRDNMPRASLAVSSASGPYTRRAELGLYEIPRSRYEAYRIEWGCVLFLMPASLRRDLGLVMNREVDAILDASGYRYSDVLNPRHVRSLAKRARRSRREARKFVLLPQAFGPFSHESKEHLATIVDSVDLVYPRDELSYKYIVDHVGERANVRIAPDFTATLPGFLRPQHDGLRGRLCVIPNKRMLDQTEETVRVAYIPLMRECLRRALESDMEPFVLIHEMHDEALAHEMVDGLPETVDVIKESDARAVKGIVGATSAVISSRFHGLVNALSQGVPALGTGWSHKYEMLFKDYGFAEGVVPVPAEDDVLERKLSMLMEESSRARLASQLRDAAERQKRAVEGMWEEVFAVLRQG